MLRYLIKRLFLLIPVLFTVATLVFFLIRLVPGDPVDFILGENALPVDRSALLAEQHFDKPLLQQYIYYWKDIFSGKLGQSYFSQKPVIALIAERFPATIELALWAIFWAVFISIPLGVFSSLKKGSFIDHLSLVLSLAGISIPSFYLGPLLVLFFSIYLDLFPVAGRQLSGSFFLPSLTLGAAMAALLTRMTRSSMLDVLLMDFIRTARAKGLPQHKIIIKHALSIALLPVIAILGLQLGTLLAGTIVTEKIFSWPGLGTLMLEAISKRDYAVVQGCVLVIATSYVLVNLLTDLIYTRLDPRIELTK